MRLLAAAGPCFAAVECAPAQLDQGIGPALGRRARVAIRGRAHDGFERGTQGGPALAVEVAVEPVHAVELADPEAASRVLRVGVLQSAVGVDRVLQDLGRVAQLLRYLLATHVDQHLLVLQHRLGAAAVDRAGDHARVLVVDLARAKRRLCLGQ